MNADTLDTFDTIVLILLAVMAAVAVYGMYESILARRGFHRFLREHNFRKLPPVSTMWLARVIEHHAALHVAGEWDAFQVTIHRYHNRRTRGMRIVVTADNDLMSASAGNVTIGPWTNPAPPALLQHGLEASGRELRLRIGETPDPAPYVAAVVAYARTLAGQPA